MKIRLYADCIGYSLVFGTILAKLWRIYFIFHDPFKKMKTRVRHSLPLTIIFMLRSFFMRLCLSQHAESVRLEDVTYHTWHCLHCVDTSHYWNSYSRIKTSCLH